MSPLVGSRQPKSRSEREPTHEASGPSPAEPMVRILFPPAESLSLAPSRSRAWRTPAFREGVRGWLGDWVGRDAQVVSIPQQPAAISLSRHIPVPELPSRSQATRPTAE